MSDEKRKLLERARDAMSRRDARAVVALLPQLDDAFSAELIRTGRAALARRLGETARMIREGVGSAGGGKDWKDETLDFAQWEIGRLVGELILVLLLGA